MVSDHHQAKGAGDGLPAIMDIEASGFGLGSYPIEVGFVLPDGVAFCTLICPLPHWTHWDPSAEGVHHIQRELLARHGRPVDDVARLLNERLEGLTVYCDAWTHDYSWLSALFAETDRVPRFKLDDLRRLLSDGEAYRWHATKDLVSLEMTEQRHRASADARLLQTTLRRLRSG